MSGFQEKVISITVDSDEIEGSLVTPNSPKSIIIFAHGSGSSRHSPRNKSVASYLQSKGFATLLIDLLSQEEEKVDIVTTEFRFDIDLLTKRLLIAKEWVKTNNEYRDMKIGYFGASTGAAAALKADAREGGVYAIVSRGGRPDLAGTELLEVNAPSLMIVGGADDLVIRLNKDALGKIRSSKKLEIVPGATHLFEEAGALEEVSRLAANWFLDNLI